MNFNSSITSIIQQRTSIRTYNPEPLENQVLTKIQKILQETKTSPFGGESDFKILNLSNYSKTEKIKLGTYGFIQGAPYFLVGTIKQHPFDLEHYGHVFEHIILKLTALKLGTCWLGGTFKRKNFTELILDESESLNKRIPAITPIGRSANTKSLRSKLIKLVARSHKRKAWHTLFFEGNLEQSLDPDKIPQYTQALENVRMAPSAVNRQPWRVIKDPKQDIFHFFIQRKHITPEILNREKYPDMPRLDIGIAICHFDLTLKEQNIPGNWLYVKSYKNKHTTDQLQYTISWKRK